MNCNKLDKNRNSSVSIDEIHELAYLIVNSNNELHDTFLKTYSIHVLTHLIKFLCNAPVRN